MKYLVLNSVYFWFSYCLEFIINCSSDYFCKLGRAMIISQAWWTEKYLSHRCITFHSFAWLALFMKYLISSEISTPDWYCSWYLKVKGEKKDLYKYRYWSQVWLCEPDFPEKSGYKSYNGKLSELMDCFLTVMMAKMSLISDLPYLCHAMPWHLHVVLTNYI